MPSCIIKRNALLESELRSAVGNERPRRPFGSRVFDGLGDSIVGGDDGS
jgi:hypothetical protein